MGEEPSLTPGVSLSCQGSGVSLRTCRQLGELGG